MDQITKLVTGHWQSTTVAILSYAAATRAVLVRGSNSPCMGTIKGTKPNEAASTETPNICLGSGCLRKSTGQKYIPGVLFPDGSNATLRRRLEKSAELSSTGTLNL